MYSWWLSDQPDLEELVRYSDRNTDLLIILDATWAFLERACIREEPQDVVH